MKDPKKTKSNEYFHKNANNNTITFPVPLNFRILCYFDPNNSFIPWTFRIDKILNTNPVLDDNAQIELSHKQ